MFTRPADGCSRAGRPERASGVPRSTRSAIVIGSLGNRRMVSSGPSSANGGRTAFTRLPSGRRTSTIGLASSTRRPPAPTTRSITWRRCSASRNRTASGTSRPAALDEDRRGPVRDDLGHGRVAHQRLERAQPDRVVDDLLHQTLQVDDAGGSRGRARAGLSAGRRRSTAALARRLPAAARSSPRAREPGTDPPWRRTRSSPAPRRQARRASPAAPFAYQRSRSSRPSSYPDIDRRSSRTTAATGASTILEIARNPMSARRDQRFTTSPGSAAAPHLATARTSARAASSAERVGVTTTSTRSAATSASRGAAGHGAPDIDHREVLACAQLAHELGAPPRRQDAEKIRIGRPGHMAQAGRVLDDDGPDARGERLSRLGQIGKRPVRARTESERKTRTASGKVDEQCLRGRRQPESDHARPDSSAGPGDRDHPSLPHVGRRAACPADAQGVGYGGGEPWRGDGEAGDSTCTGAEAPTGTPRCRRAPRGGRSPRPGTHARRPPPSPPPVPRGRRRQAAPRTRARHRRAPGCVTPPPRCRSPPCRRQPPKHAATSAASAATTTQRTAGATHGHPAPSGRQVAASRAPRRRGSLRRPGGRRSVATAVPSDVRAATTRTSGEDDCGCERGGAVASNTSACAPARSPAGGPAAASSRMATSRTAPRPACRSRARVGEQRAGRDARPRPAGRRRPRGRPPPLVPHTAPARAPHRAPPALTRPPAGSASNTTTWVTVRPCGDAAVPRPSSARPAIASPIASAANASARRRCRLTSGSPARSGDRSIRRAAPGTTHSAAPRRPARAGRRASRTGSTARRAARSPIARPALAPAPVPWMPCALRPRRLPAHSSTAAAGRTRPPRTPRRARCRPASGRRPSRQPESGPGPTDRR